MDDEIHWQLVVSEQRVLVTSDSDFLNFHDQGRPHWGIAYCHQQSRTIGQLIHTLELIWEELEPEDMQNRVEYIVKVNYAITSTAGFRTRPRPIER